MTQQTETPTTQSSKQPKQNTWTKGTVAVERVSPEAITPETKVINVILSLDETAKLAIALQARLLELMGNNRSTTAGKRAGTNLTLHVKTKRLAVNPR